MVRTPYGFKRDRWINGDVAGILGCDPGLLQPIPTRGTLLGNLTSMLDGLLGISEPAFGVKPQEFEIFRLTESPFDVDETPGQLSINTYFVSSRATSKLAENQLLLVYTLSPREGVELLVTAFMIEPGYRDFLLSKTSPGPITAKFNLHLPLSHETKGKREYSQVR